MNFVKKKKIVDKFSVQKLIQIYSKRNNLKYIFNIFICSAV